METENLFTGEEKIAQSDDKVIVLTSHRIRYNASQFGKAHIVSIMLKNVSSIEIHFRSWLLILYLGIALLIAAVAMIAGRMGDEILVVLVAGVVCIIFFLLSRKHVVTILSDGGSKINFLAKGMKREKLMYFINQIETAKHNLTDRN